MAAQSKVDNKSKRWCSARECAEMLGVSVSQLRRLAVKHNFRALDTSTGTKGRNQGVRYSLRSIEDFEEKFSTS
jgi:hypothetical protein